MDTLWKDLVFAVRTLRRQPGFGLVTVLTLALGLGANTAVFSVVNGVLLRPLPYPQPERLMYITSQFPNIGFDQFWVSAPEFVEFRDHNESFVSVGAYRVGAANLGAATPIRVVSAAVTQELMPTLGVAPVLGRWFTADECRPDGERVVILSYELWRRAFSGAPDIVGRMADVNGRPQRIVGVMPQGYDVHDQHVELWGPLRANLTDPNTRSDHYLYLVGRAKPGVTLARARADVERMLGQWQTYTAAKHVPNPTTHRIRLDALKEDIVGGVKRALVVLQAAVVFILLIACANLANLFIARADSRMREYAVRTALGASAGRLLRQLLTEGLLLAGGAALAGLGLASLGLRTLLAVSPQAIPRTADVALDWRVLAFALTLTILTGVLFGLVPLLHLRTARVGETLKDAGSRSATAARASLRRALVVTEVALAVMLAVGAGLLIRSFVNLLGVDVGFNRSQLVTFGVVLPEVRYDGPRRVEFFNQVIARLQDQPGVASAAAMYGLPPVRDVDANDTFFEFINAANRDRYPPQNVDFWQVVTLGYERTMGVPVVKGRAFEERDAAAAPVVLINEALARRFFVDRDPIGQRLRLGNAASDPWFTVVGVLGDVRQTGMDNPAGTELYLLADQLPKAAPDQLPDGLHIVARTAQSGSAMAPVVRRVVSALDPALPVVRLTSMKEVIGDAVARPRFLTMLLGLFAGLALALAAVGTYGILSYLVTERRQEIGIRMALGADSGSILTQFLLRGLLMTAVGLVSGLALSAVLTRLMRPLLFNVRPIDPTTLGGVVLVIAVVAAAACAVPAWRAARVDPIVVLRDQ